MTLTLLGKESNDFTKIPSEKIYYGIYPYKVKIKMPVGSEDDNGNKVPFYERLWLSSDIIKLYAQQNLNQRIRLSPASITTDSFCVFLSNIHDYTYFIRDFKEDVMEVFGPVNKKHKEILLSNKNIAVKKKNFYNEYNIRIRIYPQHYSQYRDNFFGEVTTFFKENLESCRILWGRRYSVTMYTNQKYYDDISGFTELALPPHKKEFTHVYKYKW